MANHLPPTTYHTIKLVPRPPRVMRVSRRAEHTATHARLSVVSNLTFSGEHLPLTTVAKVYQVGFHLEPNTGHVILVPTLAFKEAKAFRRWHCFCQREQGPKCRKSTGTGELDVSGSRLG